MFAQPTRNHWKCLVPAAMVLTLAGVFVGPVAFAKVAVNTIDPVASVTDDGHHLIVTGPIACTESQRAYLRVTVTQRSTGAVAEGRTLITCTGGTQQWEIHAAPQGQGSLYGGARHGGRFSSHHRSWRRRRCASMVGECNVG